MIAFVSGTVAALAPDTAVLEVGGVGMAVQCTPNTLSTLRLGGTNFPIAGGGYLRLFPYAYNLTVRPNLELN